MILLDTHIWVWLVQSDSRLTARHRAIVEAHREAGLGVYVFSCWEVAMLVAKSRLVLPLPPSQWVDRALQYPSVQLIALTPRVLVESTTLPEPIHPDPADRILVATARDLDIPILSDDAQIQKYPHVQKALS